MMGGDKTMHAYAWLTGLGGLGDRDGPGLGG